MILNMHGTQYGLSQHNKILKFYKALEFNWLCSKTSKCNIKWAGSRDIHSFYAKWTEYENTLSHAYKIFLLHDMLRHWVLYNSSNTCLRFLT